MYKSELYCYFIAKKHVVSQKTFIAVFNICFYISQEHFMFSQESHQNLPPILFLCFTGTFLFKHKSHVFTQNLYFHKNLSIFSGTFKTFSQELLYFHKN